MKFVTFAALTAYVLSAPIKKLDEPTWELVEARRDTGWSFAKPEDLTEDSLEVRRDTGWNIAKPSDEPTWGLAEVRRDTGWNVVKPKEEPTLE
jgi:hypothetical protein